MYRSPDPGLKRAAMGKHVSYCGFVVDSIIEEQGGKGCFGLERI